MRKRMLNKKGISGMEYHKMLKENSMSLVLGTTTPGNEAYYTYLLCLSLTASDEFPFDCSDFYSANPVEESQQHSCQFYE
jgi:hypothetical protein